MIGRVPRTIRVFLAFLVMLLLLPCTGLSLFSVLASREPGVDPRFAFLPGITMLFLLGVVALTWWLALRRFPNELVGHCAGCGYRIEGVRGDACPECGRLIETDRAGPVSRNAGGPP